MIGRGLSRYLDDLVRGRRPRPFRAGRDDAEALRVALDLRAARPGEDTPREEFVADLHDRLAAALGTPAAGAPVPAPVPLRPRTPSPLGRRRLLVRGAGLAAASAAVGATVDHVVSNRPAAGGELTPAAGAWRTVAATSELPEGAVRAFDLGTVAGFVHRSGGVARAVSGSCTHQGCRLRLADGGTLACPCHTTVFTADGDLVVHQLPVAPPPLPRFATREVDGAVQVFAPQA